VTTDFWVAGIPQSQGSAKAFVRGNRAIVTSANANLKPWRDAVHTAFQANFSELLTAPIDVELAFVLPRPKSLPKTRIVPHTKKPDLDKLVRAIFDSGTGVAWADDANVDRVSASKRYADIGEQSGVHIHVTGGDA